MRSVAMMRIAVAITRRGQGTMRLRATTNLALDEAWCGLEPTAGRSLALSGPSNTWLNLVTCPHGGLRLRKERQELW